MQTIFVFLVCLCAASPAFAGGTGAAAAYADNEVSRSVQSGGVNPSVTEQYEYYEIKGNTEDELRNELCRNGCKWKDGKIYDSVTNWHVKWDYDYKRSPDTCVAEAFRVYVDITFRYPKWVRTGDVPRQLAAKWDAYLKSLEEHENGHRNMAVDAAAELSREVAALPPASTCGELDSRIRELCHERLERLNEEAVVYDDATKHGSVQGAVFP